MIADVSSVTLDHLYLRPDSPIVLCDRRSDKEQLMIDAPVAAGCHVVDAHSIDSLATDLGLLLADDPMAGERAALREFYFDGIEPGQSTERFWEQTRYEIREHDRAVQELSRVRTAVEGEE